LPCVGCPETTACYGPQTLVHQRMTPFCFYPFHMLMLPAPTIGSDYVFKLWLNDLRREIQPPAVIAVPAAAVAAPQPAAPPVRETVVETGSDEDDARIAAILRTILSQWPDESVPAPKISPAVSPPPQVKVAPTPAPDEDGDSVQTIILGAAPPPTLDEEKTILIQPPPSAAVQAPPPEDLQATVLISPGAERSTQGPAAEDMEKTVLMRPSEAGPQAATDLEQTVLMAPPKQGPRPPQAPPAAPPKMPPVAPPRPPEHDDLAETVIIAPDPARDRRPKP